MVNSLMLLYCKKDILYKTDLQQIALKAFDIDKSGLEPIDPHVLTDRIMELPNYELFLQIIACASFSTMFHLDSVSLNFLLA